MKKHTLIAICVSIALITQSTLAFAAEENLNHSISNEIIVLDDSEQNIEENDTVIDNDESEIAEEDKIVEDDKLEIDEDDTNIYDESSENICPKDLIKKKIAEKKAKIEQMKPIIEESQKAIKDVANENFNNVINLLSKLSKNLPAFIK